MPAIPSTNYPWIDSRSYSTIAAAHSAAVVQGEEIVIASNMTISEATIITTPITVVNGGKFTKSGSGTLTINAPFKAGLHLVFDGFGPGEVTFGAGSLTEIYAIWFSPSDVGEKINTALSSVGSITGLRVVVTNDIWGGESYATQIVHNYPTTLVFPNPTIPGSQAIYTGTDSAFKITAGAAYGGLVNFGVSLVGNVNTVSGLKLSNVSNWNADGYIIISYPSDDGLIIDGASASAGAYANRLNTLVRILYPSKNGVIFKNSVSTGRCNANYIAHVIVNTMPAGYSAVKFEAGFSNNVGILSTSSGTTGSYGIWNITNEHTVQYYHADSSGDYAPFKVDGGHLIVPAFWRGSGLATNDLYSQDAVWYVDVNSANVTPFTNFDNKQGAYYTTSTPHIYSTMNSGGSDPFDAGGNLIIQGTGYPGSTARDILIAGGDPPEPWAWFRVNSLILYFNTTFRGLIKHQASDFTATPVPPTRPTDTWKFTKSMADDSAITLDIPTSAGYGFIMTTNTATRARFYVRTDGEVILEGETADVVANADTDGKLCIGLSVTQPVVIKNRLGATKLVTVEFTYD